MSRPAKRPVVALVTDSIYPYFLGGKEVRYSELARRLAARADVHIYTMQWWTGGRAMVRDGVTFHAICPLMPLYSGERRSIRQALLFALCCLRLLGRRFDVLEADHMPYIQLFPLKLVALLRRKRLVVTWHEYWGADYWRDYMGAAGRVGWWFERAAMRLPDAIIAASAGTAARLRDRLGDRVPVTVAPNGVDLDLIESVEPAAEPTDLVVVGRLLSHKRIDLLIDTVALLRADGVDVTCRIVGDGPERAALHAQAAELGVTDLVDHRDDVPSHREVYGLLKSARAFVFPSEREGFGIAVLEALACGLPVVTTSAPDNLAQFLISESGRGIVCDPDAVALAAAVRRALDHPSTPTEREWLGDFDWDAVADRVAGAVLA